MEPSRRREQSVGTTELADTQVVDDPFMKCAVEKLYP